MWTKPVYKRMDLANSELPSTLVINFYALYRAFKIEFILNCIK